MVKGKINKIITTTKKWNVLNDIKRIIKQYEKENGRKIKNIIDNQQLQKIINELINYFYKKNLINIKSNKKATIKKKETKTKTLTKNKLDKKEKIFKLKFLQILGVGKRGIVFLIKINSKKYALKIIRKDNPNDLILEGKIIKTLYELNEKEFVPKVYAFDKSYVLMSYLKGNNIEQFINFNSSEPLKIIFVLYEIIDEMCFLDTLGLNKNEMNHPRKHIIIEERKVTKNENHTIKTDASMCNKQLKNRKYLNKTYKLFYSREIKPILIDFERVKKTDKPKNLTQFISYLCSNSMRNKLNNARIIVHCSQMLGIIEQYKRLVKEFIESININNNISNWYKELNRLNCNEIYHRDDNTYDNKNKQSVTTEKIISKIKDKIFQIKSLIWLAKSNSLKEKVYSVVKEIPKSKVMTYKDIATIVKTKSYRAIGRILNKNPFLPIIPCHRIIFSSGELGGYSQGTEIKRKLLLQEGIKLKRIKNKEYINLKQYKYYP